MKLVKGISVLSAAILLAACGSDDDNDSDNNNNGTTVPATYTFESQVIAGESSVSYGGQVARNALINELKALIGSPLLTSELGSNDSVEEAVLEKLNLIYKVGTSTPDGQTYNLTSQNAYTLAVEETPVGISVAEGSLLQAGYGDLSSDKNLQGKMAGIDNPLAMGEFVGWDIAADSDNAKPDALVQSWFAAIAEQAADPEHQGKVYVSATGLDYQQLIQKFLLGSVAYSQTANDYLKATKGLLKQNSAGDKDGSKPYTSLEHQWDEGFGYFGAARDFNNYSDAQLKAQKDNDTNGDGQIDLTAEYTFSMAQYANKRDASIAGWDTSKKIMDAYLKGRQIIVDNYGTDPVADQGYHDALEDQAEIIIDTWEEIFAANVIHYINATLEDMAAMGTDAYDFNLHAKHWGELKGFALSLQFNPIAEIDLAELKQLHGLVGQAPVLQGGDVEAYQQALVQARDLLVDVYDFDGDVTQW
ncbi:hypothetical protein GCM10011297_21790 [Bacterioplanes sanyensis]|uniref:DUF4856 domain-containing protein n=1 Tax=Bacterioplanes sanyensis TaxID=1249553 RepID=UPI00167691B3|nr:DUF4856 domain-containing protein [Bacterioplanes sanyensis]GGY48473.1 hypothetical protein GCM10011297_21790 [Bacterioplanes sanyensis]